MALGVRPPFVQLFVDGQLQLSENRPRRLQPTIEPDSAHDGFKRIRQGLGVRCERCSSCIAPERIAETDPFGGSGKRRRAEGSGSGKPGCAPGGHSQTDAHPSAVTVNNKI